VFAATLGIGVAVVLAISAAPLYASRVPVTRSIGLGASLVLAAAGVLCCSAAAPSGTLPLRPLFALIAFLLFLVGSLLLLAEDGGEPDGPGGDDGDPSWWPEFEAGFRRYASRPRQPVAGR